MHAQQVWFDTCVGGHVPEDASPHKSSEAVLSKHQYRSFVPVAVGSEHPAEGHPGHCAHQWAAGGYSVATLCTKSYLI